ncbi:MAG: glycogen synthase [Flavobacteriia bacterium]|nr:MAG: glycogen synthase [Flavobacteriia bacterium]
MDEPKVLVVSTGVMPYMPETDISFLAFESAKAAFTKGMQTRIFMPRFGVVNERRHQLHEVIRLSGINLIINDIDVPLIIKVASIPRERMQVYFIDNDDYFKRKAVYADDKGKLFEDNDERLIFFTKGVVETVKKLNWDPDIIHLHGWMTALIPLYLREYYKDGALFKGSKIITSLYDDSFKGHINEGLVDKIKYDEINSDMLQVLQKPSFENLQKMAIEKSDSVVFTNPNISDEVKQFAQDRDKAILEHHGKEAFAEPYLEFYQKHIQ